jgi:hypothetical protein
MLCGEQSALRSERYDDYLSAPAVDEFVRRGELF